MDIRFEDDDLQRMYEDDAYRSKRWSRDVVRAFRKVMGWIVGATNETALYAFKSLHFEKLKGGRSGQHSLRLNDQFRLIVRVETKAEKTIVVIEIVDYH